MAESLLTLLVQFVHRLSFGTALAMAGLSPSQVTSGYFRVHSYVLLGLQALAAVVALGSEMHAALPITAAVFSYLASVAWLYEKPRAGRVFLVIVSVAALLAAWTVGPIPAGTTWQRVLMRLDPVAGGWLLGTTLAAMLLGHWYLNAPGMQLAPLQSLVRKLGGALVLRATVSGIGLAAYLAAGPPPGIYAVSLLAMRWLAGIVGVAVTAWLTWETLKIPNTQSATGILYVAVILTFLGELCAALLSADLPFAL